MYINKVKEQYLPFLRKCWATGISDSLLATVAPFDHSCISKLRKDEGYSATCTRLNKFQISKLFEILKVFPWVLECSNPLRTEQNVKYWKRNEELFNYFMELRHKQLCEDYPYAPEVEDETEVEDGDKDEESTVSTEVELPCEEVLETVSEIAKEACTCTCECEHEPTKEYTYSDTRKHLKKMLKDVVKFSVDSEEYELAQDLTSILLEHF